MDEPDELACDVLLDELLAAIAPAGRPRRRTHKRSEFDAPETTMSFRAFVRACATCGLERGTSLASLVLAALLMARLHTATGLVISARNAPRMFLGAVLVATKVLGVHPPATAGCGTLAWWARVGGMPARELHRLELALLLRLDFRVTVTPERFAAWCARVRAGSVCGRNRTQK